MKKIPNILGAIVICLLALVMLTELSVPLINNVRANGVKEELLALPMPPNTEVVESVSKAGKLTGNGNGMQYLGAMLIRSELPFEELEAYYAEYSEEWLGPFIERPNGQIFAIANEPIRFSTVLDAENYYIVHLWKDNFCPFLALDIRGH